MHVALVCPYSLDTPGGVASHVLGLASWLAQQDHRVTVVAPGTVDPVAARGVAVQLLGGARNFRFNGSVAQLAVGRSQSARAVRAAGHADVVHVHEPLTPGAAFAVARQCGPLVVTHHASFRVGPVLSRVLRRRAAALHPASSIAVSRAARDTALAATGIRGTLIGNGFLLPAAPPDSLGWRGGRVPRVGFLGRLDEPRKGFAVFRAIAGRAHCAGIDAEFVALGPGSVDPGPVRLIGQVDDAARDRELQRIDVLVAPNLGGESFGMVLVEALAAGCAVVASDLVGFRDVLAASGTGTLFPVGDVEAGLAALSKSLTAPADHLALHASVARWGWDELGPRIVAEYERALTTGDTAAI